MDYALELLKRDLETLEYAYDKFVINGTVNIESEVAKENRERVNDVKNAITILNKQAESKQLNMHDVSMRSEQLNSFVDFVENEFDTYVYVPELRDHIKPYLKTI